MCLGIPGQVVDLPPGYENQIARVDVMGAQRKVNIGLLEPPADGGPAVAPGDWVLIHMGFAVEVVDAAKAARALSGLEMMGRQDPEGAGAAALERGAP